MSRNTSGRRPKLPMRQAKLELEYLPELEINRGYAAWLPMNCAVIERTGDGDSVGVCTFFLQDETTCPRHGVVKRRVSHGEISTTATRETPKINLSE